MPSKRQQQRRANLFLPVPATNPTTTDQDYLQQSSPHATYREILAADDEPSDDDSSIANDSSDDESANIGVEEDLNDEAGDDGTNSAVAQITNSADADNEPANPKSWEVIRGNIINDLKIDTSDIVIQILTLPTTKKNKCEKIWEKYASHHPKKKCVDSIGRLLLDRSKKRGHFSKENAKKTSNAVEPIWRTQAKVSPAYSLLYRLRLHSEKGTGADKMTAEEIYQLHPIFHQYDKEKFKEWDKKMIKITTRDRELINDNIELVMKHLTKFPPRKVSREGKLIWRNHEAKAQLVDDTKNGKTCTMKPKELWESNPIYHQNFSLEDFRMQLYRQKYRELAGPYWQKKRNRAAYNEHEKSVKRMYHECHQTKWEEALSEVTKGVKNL